MRKTFGVAVLAAAVALSGCSGNSETAQSSQSATEVVVQEDHGLRVPQSGVVEEPEYYLPEPGEMKLSNEEAWSLYMNLACGVEWKAEALDEASAGGDPEQVRVAAEAYRDAIGWADQILDSGFYEWPEQSLPALVKLRKVLEAGSEEASGVLEAATAVRHDRGSMPTLEMQRALGLSDLGAPSCTGYGDTLAELAEQITELGQPDSE